MSEPSTIPNLSADLPPGDPDGATPPPIDAAMVHLNFWLIGRRHVAFHLNSAPTDRPGERQDADGARGFDTRQALQASRLSRRYGVPSPQEGQLGTG